MLRSVYGKIKQKISICEINRRRKQATEYTQNQHLGHLPKQSKHSGSIRLPNRNRRKTYRKRFDIFAKNKKTESAGPIPERRTAPENGNGFVRIPIPNRNAPGYRNATLEKNSAVYRRKPDYERRASGYSRTRYLKRRSRTHREKNTPAQKQHPAPFQRGTG